MAMGRTPNVDKINLVPLSADPASPHEGDIYYSDGTPRTEGPWVYQNGVWAQFSTGSAITVVNSLTLTPQASDPGAPAIGMLFSSDGTSRAAGIWAYSSTGWVQITGVKYQEFTQKSRFTVRFSSTANVTLAAMINGATTFPGAGGVALVTGDLVLLKNQTTSSEDGVYVVQATNPLARSTSYDSASELTYAQVFTSSGTNINTVYFQTAVLTSLSDAQTWSTTSPSYSFTIPAGVYELKALRGLGGGAGGGAGAVGSDGTNVSGGGGGGGAGAAIQTVGPIKVTPGDVATIQVGAGGVSAGAGSSTIITVSSNSIYFPGASAGATGANSGGPAGNAGLGGNGGSTYILTMQGAQSVIVGGLGGNGSSSGGTVGGAGAATSVNFIEGGLAVGSAGGATQLGGFGSGGGGAGAPSTFGAGGVGGNVVANGLVGLPGTAAPNTHYGAGGGGGSGGGEASGRAGGLGGHGADGYLRISW